ncbi:MAG: protein kinase [Planctomycetota bacterium]
MRSCGVTFTAGSGVRRFDLRQGGQVVIGRSRECDLHVNSPRLSRKHCIVGFGDRGLTLTDQGSSNGTFVNGHRVEQVLLRPGDIIQLGGIAIRVDFDPRAAAQLDLRCERCGRLVSMARCEDGQVFELGKQFLCPECVVVLRHQNLSQAEQHMVDVLKGQGFEVEGKSPLSGGIIPVFKARRRDLGTPVLVKALPLLAGVSPKKIKRFQTEAKTAAKVRHENVVEIYDIREAENVLFIVMEHVDGELLLTHLERKGKLKLRPALRVGLRMARALVAAHRQGIVHRDLKPGGILIDQNGSPKVCDFGLAKDLWSITSDVTGPEETLGTVRYMPPEQVKNARAADHRADIYSWGATLYHVLTGRPPYHDRAELELMGQVISGSLPAFDPGRGEDLPEPIARLLKKAMAPDPLGRYQSADDLEAALGEVIVQHLGVPGFKGDPELLLSLDQGMLDSTWRGPAPGGMAGSFSRGDELIEFLQMVEFNKKAGILSIQGSRAQGHLAFQDGRLRAAVTQDGRRGDAAVNALLDVREGRFEFKPQLPAGFAAQMDTGVSSLLLDVLRRRDEEEAEETGSIV